jgi:predicted lipoprotein with Yx(FWY)xxD motif
MEQHMNTPRRTRRLFTAALVIASGLGTGAAWAYTAPYSTPEGIILVDVVKLMDGAAGTVASPQLLWRRLGDAHGNPLYTYDADQGGKSSCYDACAQQFPPFVADARAKGFGDWSILLRDDRVRQWVYQDKPLYRYSGTDPVGEPIGGSFQLKEEPAWHDPASSVYSPKQGWQRAAFTPEKTAVMPTSVQLQLLPVASGFGLVDAATHMTIYSVPISHKLSSDWQPVRAAALAVPIGAFSVFTSREDGARQWAYQGEALYTYSGDYSQGDTNGIFTGDRSIHAALFYRNFMPAGITVGNYVGRGPLMVTSSEQTLYMVARFHATYGGREALGSYSISYNEVKSQGTVGCQGDCTVTWKPVLAPAKAQASGFWELVARPDGSNQWAYMGSPIYSYSGDKKPGDAEGNNVDVIVYGGPQGEVTFASANTGPRIQQPRLGNLDMAAAVGARPGEKASYVAGDGYVPSRAELAGIGYGDRPAAPATAAAANAQGTAAAATGPDRSDRARDHGAGFYWHTVPLIILGER